MNNIVEQLKKVAKNKNTVTIVGVLLILGLLYWVYSSQINRAVNPVNVPIASQTIQPRTQITQALVTTMSVPSISVKDNVFTNVNEILNGNFYSNVNTVIPRGSMFFREALIRESQLPDSAFFEIEEGEIPYYFRVTFETSFLNSIFPGSHIDMYMSAINEDNTVMVGRLLEKLRVVAVRDAQGRDVFENTDENRQPAFFIFGLPPDIHLLIRRAQLIRTNSIVLFPVPYGGTSPIEGDLVVSSEFLRNFINARSIEIEDDRTIGITPPISDPEPDSEETE